MNTFFKPEAGESVSGIKHAPRTKEETIAYYQMKVDEARCEAERQHFEEKLREAKRRQEVEPDEA